MVVRLETRLPLIDKCQLTLRFPLRLLRIDQVVRGWLQGKETIDIYVMVY